MNISIRELHERFRSLSLGTKHVSERARISGFVLNIEIISKRLLFISLQESLESTEEIQKVQLIVKDRDGFLSIEQIKQITDLLEIGVSIHAEIFPERLIENKSTSVHAHAVSVKFGEHIFESLSTEETIVFPEAISKCPETREFEKHRGHLKKGGRARHFVNFLISEYGWECLNNAGGVLDVAGGGKGGLSFELSFRRRINTICVDPRRIYFPAQQLKVAQAHCSEHDPAQHLQTGLIISENRFGGKSSTLSQLEQLFDENFTERNEWKNCSIVVGMHPDEACEDVVRFALKHNKSFAVVPCCVFPKTNPHRFIDGQSVSNYSQFLDYLQGLSPLIQRKQLDFEGRNIVLYYHSS